MPKEIIDDIVCKDFKVVVPWARDGQVQIATTAPPKRGGFELDGDPFWGWYVTLDREGINKLIRVLRRARDQAFGADA